MNTQSAQPRPLIVCLLLSLLAGCQRSSEYPSRPITLVVPWAAGGGTDRVSRQMAAHLEQELKVPVNVINATGGKGVTGHSRGLHARPDGYTLQMATLELNMMHWTGLTNLTYKDCIPLMSLNEDYAALFVRTDAPWKDLGELEQAIREAPGTLKSSGTTSGGAWHLALAGWLMAADFDVDDVVWISSTGANPSLQELISGGIDMVCCSLPEAETLYKAGQVRVIGVMSPKPVPGYEEVPTFVSQGRDWTLGGWRALALPVGTPPHIVEKLQAAVRKVVKGETTIANNTNGTEAGQQKQTFPEFMDAAGFDRTYREGDELQTFFAETDEKFGNLLTTEAMKSVNTERYDSMAWPTILMGLIGLTLCALTVTHFVGPRTHDHLLPHSAGAVAEETAPVPVRGVVNFLLIVGGVVLYCFIIEEAGFLVTAGALLFILLVALGTRVWVGALITVICVPLVWQLFAGLLRVPLPPGEWGL
ncbi:MAG: tripartite tricarboxylate transporter TctB family protein [Planctomycetaceae bacterium]|nr:tripartite tricarboxylate transporter TctB family protein [Planctomycetaceae bacterium]